MKLLNISNAIHSNKNQAASFLPTFLKKTFSSLREAIGIPDNMILNELDIGGKTKFYFRNVRSSLQTGVFNLFEESGRFSKAHVLNDAADPSRSKVWDINPSDPNWVKVPVRSIPPR